MAFMNRNNPLIIFCILWCLSLPMIAQSFQSTKLADIAKSVSLSPKIGDGVSGYVDAGSYKGLPLTVGRDSQNTIIHIGYKFFPEEMKSQYPSIVYDFIERYMLELDCLTKDEILSQHLWDDKVIIREGNMSNIRRIKSNTSCTINLVENKYYNVIWKQGENTILDIAFPVQYELLLGMPKIEIEKIIRSQIVNSPARISTASEIGNLNEISTNVFETEPVQNYYVQSMNNAKYYSKTKEDQYYPIFDSEKKWYSAANLFQGVIRDTNNYKIYVEQNLYGFQKNTYTITLAQWLNYCKENDITTYFAVEEERQDGLKCLLIAQSLKLGFNHMMSIIIPDNFVDNHHAVFKAQLNAYIPTQNVKNLYQQYVKKPKKKI